MPEKRYYPLILILLGALFFIPGLGAVHLFDWDEINFAEISREMILTGNYSQVFIDFQPFWEKPPFFFWLQVLAMKSFGINEFAARLPNALCGILTLYLLYRLGSWLRNPQFGWFWALAYFGSILPHLYFKSGIIDPVFNLLIFVGLLGFVFFNWKKENWRGEKLTLNRWIYLIGGGMALGLAVLTKGPAALLITGLCIGVYWILKKFRGYISIPSLIVFGLSASVLTLAWFGQETLRNGPWFVQEFITYQIRLLSTEDAGHGGFPGYHFVVLLVGCFPASVFALPMLWQKEKSEEVFREDFSRWMKIIFWVVLILFSLVQSKIVHYSSLCYFPLTYLAATGISQIIPQPEKLKLWMKGLLVFIGLLFVSATLLLPLVVQNSDWIIPYIDDPFAVASLQAPLTWTGLEFLPGLVLALVIFVFLWKVKNMGARAFTILFTGTAVFIWLTLFFYIQKIEHFSQGAAIEFWKSKAEEEAYLGTFEYKSYAPLFYGRKQPDSSSESHSHQWLQTGKIDRPVYLACKINKAKKLAQIPGFQEIERKNGFVFFVRYPEK